MKRILSFLKKLFSSSKYDKLRCPRCNSILVEPEYPFGDYYCDQCDTSFETDADEEELWLNGRSYYGKPKH